VPPFHIDEDVVEIPPRRGNETADHGAAAVELPSQRQDSPDPVIKGRRQGCPRLVMPVKIGDNEDGDFSLPVQKSDEPGQFARMDSIAGSVRMAALTVPAEDRLQIAEKLVQQARRYGYGQGGPLKEIIRPSGNDDQFFPFLLKIAVDQGFQDGMELGGPATENQEDVRRRNLVPGRRVPPAGKDCFQPGREAAVTGRLDGRHGVAADDGTEEFAVGGCLFRGQQIRRQGRHRCAPMRFADLRDSPGGKGQRLLPRDVPSPPVIPELRPHRPPVMIGKGAPAETAPDAEQIFSAFAVQGRRYPPEDISLHIHVDGAAKTAMAAYRPSLLQLPDPGGVLKELVRKGPDGTGGDAKTAEIAIQLAAAVRADIGPVAPLDKFQLAFPLKIRTNPDAASTEDAAVHIPGNEGRVMIHRPERRFQCIGRPGHSIPDHQLL